MALPRKPVPKDSPAVLAVRERMKPTDGTVVVSKTVDSCLVVVRDDGSLVPYEGHIEPIDSRALKTGMAEKYAYYWGNSHPRRIAELKGRGRWMPVKKSDGICYAPFAYGDHTDGLIHNDDTILMYRAREISDQERKERDMFNDPQRYLEQRSQEMEEELAPLGAKNITQTVEQDQDAVVFDQDPSAG
jgi:hypothetical protein